MAKFLVETSAGRSLEVTAKDEAEALSIANQQLGSKAPSKALDVAKQAASGIVEGIAHIPTAMAEGANAIAPYVNSPEDEARRKDLMAQGGPTPNDVISGVLPDAETTAGRYARAAGRTVPAAIGGMKGSVPLAAASGVGTGVGAEAAGDLAKDTPLEGPARFVGGLAGGVSPLLAAAKARSLLQAQRPQAPAAPQPAAPAQASPQSSPLAPIADALGNVAPDVAADVAHRYAPLGLKNVARAGVRYFWPKKAAPEAPPPATVTAPPTGPQPQPRRQMPWGGDMPAEPSVPSSPLPLAPKAVQAELLDKVRGLNKAQQSQQSPVIPGALSEPPAGLPDELAAAVRAQNSLRGEATLPRPAAEPAAPPAMPTAPPAGPGAPVERAAGGTRPEQVEALLRGLSARQKLPGMVGQLGPEVMPPRGVAPEMVGKLNAMDSASRASSGPRPPMPQSQPPQAPPMAPPQAPPMAPPQALPEDLSIPDFLRRTPNKVTKKDGEVKVETKPPMQAATETSQADRYAKLRKEREDADSFNTIGANSDNPLYVPAHSAAREGRTPREAANHIADQWEMEGKAFNSSRSDFVNRLEKLMQPKYELADDLARVTGEDKGVLREHLIGPLDADMVKDFRTELQKLHPSASRDIEAVMPDDRIVETWTKYKTKQGKKPKSSSSPAQKNTTKMSSATKSKKSR